MIIAGNFVKKLIAFISFILLFLYSHIALAQDKMLPFKDFFDIKENDTSRALLMQIFGDVGGILPTEQTTIFKVMFTELNQAILVLVVLVIMYTVLMGIIQTAYEGEFLGKKLHSIWVPFRSVGGFIFAVPTATGYSIIQIFMMWIVLQGIGAADVLWETVINYLATGGAVVAPATINEGSGITFSQKLLAGLVCRQERKSPGELKVSTETNAKQGTRTLTIDFGSYRCGKATFEIKIPPKEEIPEEPLSETTYLNQVNQAVFLVLQNTLRTHINTLDNVAKTYVEAGRKEEGQTAVIDKFGSAINPLKAFNDAIRDRIQRRLDNLTKELEGKAPPEIWQKAIDYGWANAGAYYHALARLSTNVSEATQYDNKFKFKPASPPLKKGDAEVIGYFVRNALGELAPSQLPTGKEGSLTDASTKAAGNILSSIIRPFQVMLFTSPQQKILAQGDPTSVFLTDPAVNPIMKVQLLGNQIMYFVTLMWTIQLIIMIPIAILSHIWVQYNFLWGIFYYSLVWVLGPLLVFMGILYVTGLTMAVYIPMIPYIIFFFGVIGWLIAVIETMIAAPMVALGLAHSEGGHEVLGRAAPSVQLIMNVFFRPTLMIFGLISAMMLSHVAMNYLNSLFGAAMRSVMSTQPDLTAVGKAALPLTVAVQWAMFIVLYVGMVIALLNRCFSLIHLFPDKILGWIGWQAQFGAYAGAPKEVGAQFAAGAGVARGRLDAMAAKKETYVKERAAERDKLKAQRLADLEADRQAAIAQREQEGTIEGGPPSGEPGGGAT